MLQRRRHPGLSLAITLSMVLHGVAVLGIAIYAGTGRAMHTPPEAVEVQLTRLGKQRPEEYMPRKESAPPPPEKAAPTPTEETAPKVKAPPKSKAPETAKEKVPQKNRLSSALDRIKNMDEPEGDESGSEYGNTGELVDATARARFVAELRACLQSHFFLEGVASSAVAGKVAHVRVSVKRTGSVSFLGLDKSSGDERVDRQIVNAARRCKKVGQAPASIGNSWASGVLVKFKPEAG